MSDFLIRLPSDNGTIREINIAKFHTETRLEMFRGIFTVVVNILRNPSKITKRASLLEKDSTRYKAIDLVVINQSIVHI